MLRRSPLVLAVLAFALALAQTSEASGPVTVDAPTSDPLIASGEAVVACGWPTAVAVTSGPMCTGTLIHPRVVVYAAHCGAGKKTIRFGEDAWAGGRSVEVESCKVYPNYAGATDQGHDWAYCVLAEAVDDLPLAPPLYGCERELLEVGKEVAIVGFGQAIDGPSGVKRWAAATLAGVTPGNNTTLVGNANVEGTPSFCNGDSGGPALLELDDGSWRTFGIASTVAGGCGGYGAHSTLAGAVPWIEQNSGFDITPCHAIDGSWAPSPACTGALSQAPNVGAGGWPNWCAGTPSVGSSTSCGPAWDEFDASALPSVSIHAPSSGETFLQGTEIDVQVIAAKHAEGFAIATVSLAIDGEIVAVDDNDPWQFLGPSFPGPGLYSLVAIAEDWAGNQVESEPVVIAWGEAEFPDPGTDTGGYESPTGAGESSCAIAGEVPARGWTIALLMIALLGWRVKSACSRTPSGAR